MTAATKLTPTRQKAYEGMTGPTKQLADKFYRRICASRGGEVLAHYDLGAEVAKVLEDETRYGSQAVSQLAAYFNLGDNKRLLAYARWPDKYDRATVEEYAKPSPDGSVLCVQHWMLLCRLAKAADRAKLLARCHRDSWPVRQLGGEISACLDQTTPRNSGGRTVQPAETPGAEVQATFKATVAAQNRLGADHMDAFLDALAAADPLQMPEPLRDKIRDTAAAVLSLSGIALTVGTRLKEIADAIHTKVEEYRNQTAAAETESGPKPEGVDEGLAEAEPVRPKPAVRPSAQRNGVNGAAHKNGHKPAAHKPVAHKSAGRRPGKRPAARRTAKA